jgi:hypothetical protein
VKGKNITSDKKHLTAEFGEKTSGERRENTLRLRAHEVEEAGDALAEDFWLGDQA